MTTGMLFPNVVAPRSSKERYRRQSQAIILRRALRGEEVTADDVHIILSCPEDIDPNNLGLAFSALADAGLIAPVRFERSTRPTRHRGFHRSWRIADDKTARAYLTALEKSGDAEADIQANRNRTDSRTQVSEKSCGQDAAYPRLYPQSSDTAGHLKKYSKIPLPKGESERQIDYARNRKVHIPGNRPEHISEVLKRMGWTVGAGHERHE